MDNMEKIGCGLLKVASSNTGRMVLLEAGKAAGGVALTVLETVAPVAFPVLAVYGLYKLFSD